MKKPLVILFLLSLTLAACTPNRLSKSLEQSEASSRTETLAPTPDGRSLQPQLGNANIDLDQVVTLLPPDAISAILPDQVPALMITADEADERGMQANTRVLGVSINGESRAYPVPYMSEHEIVNDEVGGQHIAATW